MKRIACLLHAIDTPKRSLEYAQGWGRLLTEQERRYIRKAGRTVGREWRVLPDWPGHDQGTIYRPSEGGGLDQTSIRVEPR
jgi:hypothetical protein